MEIVSCGKKLSAEHKRKISEKMKGRVFSKEWKEKLSKSVRESMTPELRKRISDSVKKTFSSPEMKRKLSEVNRGRKHSEVTKEKIRSKLIGREFSSEWREKIAKSVGIYTRKHPVRYWLGKKRDESFIRSQKLAMAGRRHSEEHNLKIKMSLSTEDNIIKAKNRASKLWKTEEYVKKQMLARNIKPNKPEQALTSILNTLFPSEWKYVGDGQVIIGGKCPDFINVNGKKLIIELFGNYWHRNDDPENRKKCFLPYGYDTLIIWESELVDLEKVKKKILSFSCSWRDVA